jgi:hypothetical protein
MKVVKTNMVGRMKHRAQVGKMRNLYNILVEKREIKETTQLTYGLTGGCY